MLRLRRLLGVAVLSMMPSLADATVFYIDPTCANNGTGTTTDCAQSGGAAGAMNAWPNPATGPGNEYRQKAGTTYLNRVVVGSGSVAEPLIIGAYGTGAKPIIRSEEVATTGSIQINTDAANIIIDGLEVHGQRNLEAGMQANAIRNDTSDSHNTVVNITVQNCIIGPVISFGGADDDDGIDLRGRGLYVIDNTFADIANDAVWIASDGNVNDMIIRGNTCSRVSQVGTSGDCYQTSGTSTGVLIEENTCDHSDRDTKHCIVANNHVVIRYNTNIGPVGGAIHTQIYCDVGPCWIYGNKTLYGRIGIANYGTTGGTTYGNLVLMPDTYGIEVAATFSPVVNNTVRSRSSLAAIRFTSVATGGHASNNIAEAPTEGIRLTSGSSQTESFNLFHGDITTPIYNTTTGSALVPTNAVIASNQLTTDHKLVAESTAKRAGTPSPFCLDLRGRACPPDSPNIGAYQSTSGDQAAPRYVRN